jgi:uncharacterized OB-fold protein
MATAANASSDVRSLVPNDAVSQEFWEAVQASELKVQKCDACGHLWFPPSDACPQCLSPSYTWAPVSGRATVYSWVVYHHRYHPAFEPPYNVAIVELEEGVRMPTNIVGCPLDEIHIDMPVEVVFEKIDDLTVPRFAPRGD